MNQNKLNVVKVRLVPDVPLYSNKEVTTPEQALEVLQKEMATYDREIFGVLNLDTKGQPINFNIVSMGTLNSSVVNPREVFKSVILSNAASMIVIHNHPSGDSTPSYDDIAVTKRLAIVAKVMGINLLDHIVVGNQDYASFLQKGIMDQINQYITSISDINTSDSVKENSLKINPIAKAMEEARKSIDEEHVKENGFEYEI